MLYQRSLEIERRLNTLLRLIQTGLHSTPKLAEWLGVSIPISFYEIALRARGYNIKALKEARGWRFVLERKLADQPKPKLTDIAETTNELTP
jgi:hypothetical protein